MFKILSVIQPYLGLVAIVYPILQKIAVTQGIYLPDLGAVGDTVSQVGGAAIVAKSNKI